MNILAIKPIIIRKLSNYREIEALLSEPRIKDLADAIKELGMMNEPWVRQSTYSAIAGRDRFAAHIVNGDTECRAKMIECTDDEAEQYRITENLHRRHSAQEQQDLTAQAVVIATMKEEARRKRFKQGKKPVGRPKGAAAKAIEHVARLRGVRPETVRRTMANQAAKVVESLVQAADAGAPTAVATATIKTLGMEVGQDFIAGAAAAQAYIAMAAKGLRAARQALAQLKTSGVPYPQGLLTRLHDDVSDAYERVKLGKPMSLCPHCKGLAGIQEECAGCVTSGVITEGQKAGVPAVLWTEGDGAMVQQKGALRSVWDVIERPGEVADATSWLDPALQDDEPFHGDEADGGMFEDMEP